MKEEEIRPQLIFEEYLRLAEIDASVFFDGVKKEFIKCPACNLNGEHAFIKNSFDYVCCPECNTLYVSPRPSSIAFNRYYMEAPSVEYWATTFYKATEEGRREKLWKPKAKMIKEKVERFGDIASSVIDIGGGYGIFAEEMELLINNPVTVIEPGPQLAISCREKGVNVVEKFLEDVTNQDLPDSKKVFVSFELFEHLHNPESFLDHLFSLMQSGDLFIFTTLSGSGVDIQALWEDSKSVSPPHHLNFLNPYSIKLLLNRVGLKELEITTPGKLDIDILSNNSNKIKDRFWREFILRATTEEKEVWQQIISDSGWSSHMMVVCRKP
jgi:2-polyprenyl-3-methyl-5-hydroxy-6-metoxy-1,4-benzoquinol methylase